MISHEELRQARADAVAALGAAGVVLTAAEREQVEVADFGLSRLRETGLRLAV